MIVQISRARLILYIALFISIISLWLIIGHVVEEQLQPSAEGQVSIRFKFLAPMRPSAVNDLVIERIRDGQKVPFKYTWLTASTLQIHIFEKDYPRGLKYRYKFTGAPAMIWPFYVWARGEFQSKVKLRFIGIERNKATPSRGPVVLQFNTAVKPESISQHILLPEPGRLEPLKTLVRGKQWVVDYSRWQYWPSKKLQNQHEYTIEIKKELTGDNGSKLGQTVQAKFTTTPEFLIEQIYPLPGSDSVWLTRSISLTTNQPLQSVHIEIKGLPGQYQIENNQVKFRPDHVMLPDTTYHVKTQLTSTSNEVINYQFSFHTTNLGQNKWLQLRLAPSATLLVLEGNKVLRQINVSLKPNRNIPQGTLYEDKRETLPTKGNALARWIKLNADILLHTLPEGVKDDHHTLGLPQSYSCIYVSQRNMEWLYHNLPSNFMLIAH